MGVVFVAEQTTPIRRKVALKIIKAGLATKTLKSRFEAERQALAMMDHPSIAKVYDGGVDQHDRPYIVMELVQGFPISEFCDKHHMSTDRRLQRFVDVCRAVEHAHQKGVIHRDLKPSNVLVAEIDDKAVPKVIDFGVAKAVGQELIDQTLYTSFTQMIGTPLYMSPEQTRMGVIDVDTRSDVYSLGVMLYELLTGTTPFASEELKMAGFDEMRRIIQEEEPSRPSTQVSTLSDKVRSTAAERRAIDHRQLSNMLKGELDWIVMKALAKDRNRRYQSAGELAEDIERYLNNEPVEAHPPSFGYRFGKLVHRNIGFVTAVAVVLLCLVGGIIGTTWGMVQARRERDAARLAQNNEEKQRQMADENALRAERAAKAAEAVLDFVQERIFAAARPMGHDGGLGYDATVRQAVEAALPFLESSFEDQPLVKARLHHAIGESFDYLGEYELALNQLQAAYSIISEKFSAEHPMTLQAMGDLGNAFDRLRRFDEALELKNRALELSKNTFGEDHANTAQAMADLAITYASQGRHVEAVELNEKALSLFEAAPVVDSRNMTACKTNLASTYRNLGRAKDAFRLHEQAFELAESKYGRAHPISLLNMHGLAHAYELVDRQSDANKLLYECFDGMKQKLGPHHPKTMMTGNCLAKSFERLADHKSAINVQEEVNKTRELKLGPNHPETIRFANEIVINYIRLRRHDKALELSEKLYKRCQNTLDENHAATLQCMNNLVSCYQGLYRIEEAAKIGKELLNRQTAVLGVDHHDTLWTMGSLAATYRMLRRNEEALELSKREFELRNAKLGVDHDDTLLAMRELALTYRLNGNFKESIQYYEEAIALHEKKNLGQYDRQTLRAMGRLAMLYRDSGDIDQAIKLFKKALEHQKNVLGENDADTVKTVEILAMECRGVPERSDEARRYTEELIVLLERANNPKRLAFMTDSAVWLAHSPDADDRSRAVELAQEVVDTDSGSGMGWHALGITQLRMEQYPQAVRSLTRADELLQADDRSHWFLLSIAEAKQNRHAAARTWYDKANEWLNQNPRETERLASLRNEARHALDSEKGVRPQ